MNPSGPHCSGSLAIRVTGLSDLGNALATFERHTKH